MSEWVHGTAVLVGSRGVLVRGPSGAGKSLLAALMIGRGALLIADDRVHLSACYGRILATAPQATHGKLELRGHGISAARHERSAVIRLVVDIVAESEMERLPESEQLSVIILGVRLRCQPVPAASAQALLLVDAALAAP